MKMASFYAHTQAHKKAAIPKGMAATIYVQY
jgi:hypothetical protein